MDKDVRNELRKVVTRCRKLLEDAIGQVLEGQFGIHWDGTVEDASTITHLSEEDRAYREQIIVHLDHIKSAGFKSKDAVAQLIREIAFTHLNRLCAYKIMETYKIIDETVSRGLNSKGFKFYLAEHPKDEDIWKGGNQYLAYIHYLGWLGTTLSEEIGVLFSPHDPANRLFPPQRVLREILDLINSKELVGIWDGDEAIGWIYQYFTPKELRDKARKESHAPRNAYELAFRNQFYTPRYVVEFLTDNTLGRTWYEMKKGVTSLKDKCKYLVIRPNEIFLGLGEDAPIEEDYAQENLSQEELLKKTVYVPHREKKDPRKIKILDPACGSGHFLLYCFDLLETIYEEAYLDPDLGPSLRKDYPTLNDMKKTVPVLILSRNLHGIDIDLRATQIAALALWLRAQKSFKTLGLDPQERPKITRSNIVLAEPMPGNREMLKEFISGIRPRVIGNLVEDVFDKIKMAGEAGTLLKIEEEIKEDVAKAKQRWLNQPKTTQITLYGDVEPYSEQATLDFAGITDEDFWDEAEARVIEALRKYAGEASSQNRLERQLFVDDAAQGFAFIDICRKRYDVVLMNPPFGESSSPSKEYIVDNFPDAYQDIFSCFINRGVEHLLVDGRCGAITNRTGFFIVSQDKWRQLILIGKSRIELLADLGHGVLDEALVETSAYIIKNSPHLKIGMFHRAVANENKRESLIDWKVHWEKGLENLNSYVRRLSSFKSLPSCRIAFWMPPSILEVFQKNEQYGKSRGHVAVGLQTSDNFRFLRLTWEINPHTIALSRQETINGGKRWVFYAKGGEYAPYYADIHLVVNWENDGEEIKNFTDTSGKQISYPRNENYYFKPGLTYSERTTSNFSIRVLPEGCCFDTIGPWVGSEDKSKDFADLPIFMSRPISYILEFMVSSADVVFSGSAARHYTAKSVSDIPYPKTLPQIENKLSTIGERLFRTKREMERRFETDRFFSLPLLTEFSNKGLKAGILDSLAIWEKLALEVIEYSYEAERLSRSAYSFSKGASEELDREFGSHPQTLALNTNIDVEKFRNIYLDRVDNVIDKEVKRIGGHRALTKKCYFADRKLELLSMIFEVHPQKIGSVLIENS